MKLRILSGMLLMCLIMLACNRRPSAEQNAPIKDEEGWSVLFDGKTLSGWKFYGNEKNNSWVVEDGVLHCLPFSDEGENFRSDLLTSEQYQNFRLQFEWKCGHQSNSGVLFRVSDNYPKAFETGPEYQLLDDANYPGDVAANRKSASCFDLYAPSKKVVYPAGQWNASLLIVEHNHVEHWLNGEKVLAYEINSDDWKQRVAQSKWRDFPAYATQSKGHIVLQDHGNEMWFRNILIKKLD